MGNSLSLIMLAAWPVVAIVLFSRLALRTAVIWTVLGGYLLLPPVVGLDLPMLPLLEKHGIPGLSALVAYVMLRKPTDTPPPQLEGWVLALAALALVTPIVTMATNPEPLIEGITYRPGLGIVDALQTIIMVVLQLIPFLLGYMVLSTRDGVRAWMGALLAAGLAYTVPMLLEVRLSPQLNVWIYGFFAHDFSQSMRYGGFRPMVFLEHGLWVAIFAVMAVLSAAVTVRESAPALRTRNVGVLLYLIVVLFLCKSVASMIYALLLVPMVLLTAPLMQVRLAAVLAAFVMIYPLALWQGLVPAEGIVDFAMSLDEQRAQSLGFRFRNEQVLLDRASMKPLAGWGPWGRNLVIDPQSGRFTSVSDGYWIVVMTISGIMGYVATFGILCGSVIRLWIAARVGSVDRWTAGLALITAANLVDLIPNATVTPLTWISLGALAGVAARGVRAKEGQAAPLAVPRHPRLRAVIG